MKVMATFDGSSFSETTMALLSKMARLPDAEFVLFATVLPKDAIIRGDVRLPGTSVYNSDPVVGRGGVLTVVETKEQATERALTEMREYLLDLGHRLPTASNFRAVVHESSTPGAAIVKQALAESPDVIVMATHGRTGLVRTLFGGTAEEVVRSGVAPVLLVHPEHSERRRGRIAV
jgi:nucleotide-binding universal stress UspA family protein